MLHLKYTAREDAGTMKNGAITHLRDYFSQQDATPALLMLNLRRDFPSQWSRFLHPTNPANGNVLDLAMSSDLFSMRDQGKTLKINTITVLARCSDPANYKVSLSPPLPPPPPPAASTVTLVKSDQYGGLHAGTINVAAAMVNVLPDGPPITWSLKMERPAGGNLAEDEVGDAIVILGYQWT